MKCENTKPTKEWFYTAKAYSEITFAVQEWCIKNKVRLFGITVSEYGPRGNSNGKSLKIPCELKPMAKTYFVDAEFKNMIITFFHIKETDGKITVSKEKGAIKWPIKFARTKWESHRVDPVDPLYSVLINRGIILPFKSTMKVKDWIALPFEDMSGIKSTEL